jgi:predicted RNase H-like HicB family nuclease
MFLEYSTVIRKEGNQYSSWSPELDVASAGDTAEDARANLEEAVNELVTTYAELGELEKFLAERAKR